MDKVDQIRKLLLETKAGEKGWRKVLARAEGSYSRTLAEKNLSRLAALHETLLNQLHPVDTQFEPGINAARVHEHSAL